MDPGAEVWVHFPPDAFHPLCGRGHALPEYLRDFECLKYSNTLHAGAAISRFDDEIEGSSDTLKRLPDHVCGVEANGTGIAK
jgi:hypothetical protein